MKHTKPNKHTHTHKKKNTKFTFKVHCTKLPMRLKLVRHHVQEREMAGKQLKVTMHRHPLGSVIARVQFEAADLGVGVVVDEVDGRLDPLEK